MFAEDRVALDLARQLRNDAERRAAHHRLLQTVDADQSFWSRMLHTVVGGS